MAETLTTTPLPSFRWLKRLLGVALPCGMLAANLSIVYLSAQEKPSSGDIVIRSAQGGGRITIRTRSRLAGAIHSLVWNKKEFIDSHDHGRQLQSAINLDYDGTRMYPETFNPTEAGACNDGAGSTSTSRLLHASSTLNSLKTRTQMAFWLAPGQQSGGHPARNKVLLSDHVLEKEVTIGYRDMPRVIVHDVTFHLPANEKHRYAQFEILTGYMPSGFDRFWALNPADGKLIPLTDGPGEQRHPVILATHSESHAMGCVTPNVSMGKGWSGPGYGRFRFEAEKVAKWNTVFRLRNPKRIQPGAYSFRTFVVVGDLEGVREDMVRLLKEKRVPL
ncbi:MAG: hypothetical protein VCA36_10525 [Opitutales bacterium]